MLVKLWCPYLGAKSVRFLRFCHSSWMSLSVPVEQRHFLRMLNTVNGGLIRNTLLRTCFIDIQIICPVKFSCVPD